MTPQRGTPQTVTLQATSQHHNPSTIRLSLSRSRVGPYLRSRAIWLRNTIGISCRKIPAIIEEMHGFTFTRADLIGFQIILAEANSIDFTLFEDVKQFVKHACTFHRLRANGSLYEYE
jgi:hypothetical protein